MRISSKGRYALASAVRLAASYKSGEYVTVISVSEELGISKIYLEQVFSLLKRGGIVFSAKGAQGGYRLSGPPEEITAYDVLLAVEQSLFEKTADTVNGSAPEIERAMQSLVFNRADTALMESLTSVSLAMLAEEAGRNKADSANMFYI